MSLKPFKLLKGINLWPNRSFLLLSLIEVLFVTKIDVRNMSYSFESEETHDVKIEDLQPLEKHINVIFKVVEKNEEREITNSRSGETHRVCDFSVADETGQITLTLWNEDIDALEMEKVYKLSNGFANIFQNSLRLSKGKFGNLTEDATVFADINDENNRSSEHVEDPRQRQYQRRSYGGSSGGDRGGYGSGRGERSGGYGRSRGRDRERDSGRSRRRW